MKVRYEVKEIDKNTALQMIQKYHYSNTLPKLNKYFVGFFLQDELVGVVTLGWGTRPRHTIQRIFPSLDTNDYLEIGRMCMTEEMPRNSESQMISQLVKWIKTNIPELKVLFTWADGMLGKVGYVYQASNFIYAGFSGGEMYMKDGVKIHVRQMKSILIPEGTHDERITVRPTLEQMKKFNILHFKGKQYRYLMFLCDKQESERLKSECLIDLNLQNPKDDDLSWTIKNVETGKWEKCCKPPYKTDIDQKTKGIINLEEYRICTHCRNKMTEGYVIEDGLEYFCSDECLHSKYSENEYEEMYKNDFAYWTEWNEQIEKEKKQMELKMNEYQLPEQILFNYEELKAELTEKVSMYETMVYTDDQIKLAKADKANLNKLKKALNDERIRREKEYMIPFNAFKTQVAEIISIIDKPVAVIDKQVKAYEEKQKQDKLDSIVDFFNSTEHPEWLHMSQIMDEKWMNASTSMKSVQDAICSKIEQVSNDLATLSNLPEFGFEATKVYETTLDMNKAIFEAKRMSEIAKAKAEAEAKKAEEEFAKNMNPPVSDEQLPGQVEFKDAQTFDAVVENAKPVEPAKQWVRFQALMTTEDAFALRDFFRSRNIEFKAV